jgi:hypothetical protein
MQRKMARWTESHRCAGQFEAVRVWSNWVVGEKKCIGVGEPEVVTIPASRIRARCRQLTLSISAMRCPAALRINMQQYFSFMTPMLATICGRGLLAATRTRQ